MCRAAAARARRVRARCALKTGQVTLAELLEAAGDDPALERMRVRDLLLALPRVGSTIANRVLDDVGVADSRRLAACPSGSAVSCSRDSAENWAWSVAAWVHAASSSSRRLVGGGHGHQKGDAWQARTYARDADGVRRQVRAQIATKAVVRQSLARALSGRTRPPTGLLGPPTTVD